MTFALLVARYGVLAILFGAAIEGEAVVVSGGLLAHEGLLRLTHVMVAAAIGSFCADQLFFLAGRRLRDRSWVRRIIERPAFARALAMLGRHPVGFVLAFRFLYGLRTVSPIAIGTSAVPARTFVLLNAVAAILWGVIFSTAGYVFGHGIALAFGRFRSAWHIGLVIVAIIAIALLCTAWRRRRS